MAVFGGAAEFLAFKKFERSNLELTKLIGAPAIDVDILIEKNASINSDSHLVKVTSILENIGTRSVVLRPSECYAYMNRIKFNDDGIEEILYPIYTAKKAFEIDDDKLLTECFEKKSGLWMIQPGEIKREETLLNVAEPRIYKVGFQVQRNKAQREEYKSMMREAGITGPVGEVIAWSASKYIFIE